MRLDDLIAGAGFARSSLSSPRSDGQAERAPDDAVEVTDLAYRSDAAKAGALFFCVPGFRVDGHDFAADAVRRGAVALVCERPLGLGVPELVVESTRAAMAPLAATFFDHPTEKLEVIGVTGTNGKTTTVFFLREILEAAGRKTGLLGTIHSVIGGEIEEVERTTPEAVDLQRALRRMVDAGDRAAVMEVSSHALSLGRTDEIDFDCAVFTNLTLDHLDYHETLDAYYEAKRALFLGPGPPRASVINVDDPWGARLAGELDRAHTRIVWFAIERNADYRAESITWDARGARFVCRGPRGNVEVSLPLPGLFNVYNALGAIAAAGSLGIEAEVAAGALAKVARVPGRFEPVDEGQDFTVLVDYAHTPDSLTNVLRAARGILSDGRLICVFGAGGDRDREKRPLMGEAARHLADHVIVTSDNPRSEEPDAIIAAIVEGAERATDAAPSQLEVEPDRRSAIARALRGARGGDVVVIAGKGHEQGQELAGGKKIPFDDRDVAREELRALNSAGARPVA